MATTRLRKTRSGNGHRQERRKNVRLRTLVDELKAGISKNRRELQLQLTRIAQIQAELDEVKRAGAKG
jgi:hypothetical protein